MFGIKSTQEQLADFREAAESGVAIVHVDTCLASYLRDHHNRDGECLFGVYVDGATSIAEVRDGLTDEIRATGDRVPDYVTDSQIAAAVASAFDVADASRPFAPSLESPPRAEDYDDEEAFEAAESEWQEAQDGSESCQAWFVLTWPLPEEEGGDAD